MNKWIMLGASLLGVLGLAGKMATQRNYFELAYPDTWPKPSYDFSQNPLSREGVALGRMLFYDPVLSRDSTISCASCHLSYTAFTHVDHELSHGIEDRIGTRNSPALMNLAWGQSFMWDGAANHLDMQALAPISAETEMDSDIATVVERLQSKSQYRQLFYQAFDDSSITGEHLLKALAQFQLTFVSADSKYDQVKRGETGVAFSEQEQKGYKLYQANCASCHQEPLFSNQGFANNGLPMDTFLQDHGRMNITQKPADDRKFKVPSLRNLKYSHPYMHDGRFAKLSEVLNHYVKGIESNETLAPELVGGLALSANEKIDLIAFLLTLTDQKFVFNRDYAYPR
ncbi:MAG: cytochrome c peroxidase [Bacteroidota bacterium]